MSRLASLEAPSPVAELDPAEVGPGVHFLCDGAVIVAIGNDGAVRATRNRCRHLGGTFARGRADAECVLTCTHHGWQLDPFAMEYVNPTNRQRQPELTAERRRDGSVALFDPLPEVPWDADPRERRQLEPGELTVRFLAHACCEIAAGGKTLFTDPWLIGPAFGRGWWLAHEPPTSWCDELASADLIYVSHNHPDHLNRWTLEAIARRNPDVPVIVPRFASDSCVALVQRAGLRNVTALRFGQWHELGDGRLMLLRDGTSRDDSGLLFEYAGHRILDTVDSADLNGGHLPSPVDLLMTSFAGGASGFPVCWEELLGEEEIERRVDKGLALETRRVAQTAKRTQAGLYMPFAGYFVEAHPSDAELGKRNRKSSPEDVARAVTKLSPSTRCWLPSPNDTLDLAQPTRALDTSVVSPVAAPRHDFEPFLSIIAKDADFEPLKSPDGLRAYFEWAGYSGDLVLHILETDDDFHTVERETMVDLAGPHLITVRPPTEHRYLRMRVRTDVFRHVLRRGLPWEEITTGFAARLYREPDAYNLDFWEHFQDRLPAEPLWPSVGSPKP